ncbi:MAG: iron-sulfur cluster assembly protein [Anaerolineaceae bacterium]|nr:iron-sulfur cluster assembly protein [Anaerolineaceae bacterium]
MEQENLNRPTWQLESIDPDLSRLLRKSLREVKDPELGLDVIELGLIRDAEPNGDQINSG